MNLTDLVRQYAHARRSTPRDAARLAAWTYLHGLHLVRWQQPNWLYGRVDFDVHLVYGGPVVRVRPIDETQVIPRVNVHDHPS